MVTTVLHPLTKQQLKAFNDRPAHALLLVGPRGSGKFTIAQAVAATTLQVADMIDYPYLLHIVPEQAAIGIDAVRRIEQFLSLKVPGKQPYRRVVMIEEAQSLSIEAQNALLKNLEEPPADTLVILTATHAGSLLPTIRSRVQTIVINQPDHAALAQQFADIDSKLYDRAYAMSGGRPGLLSELLSDSEHPLNQAADYARQILSQPVYERLLLVDSLARQPELAANVSLVLQQMAHLSLQTASGSAFSRWQTILSVSYQASEALAASVQPKLALTNLMLHL